MKFSQVFMTMILLLLVILGLNTSNQGINNLTLDRQGAVLAFGLTHSDVRLQVLGRDYAYPRDKLGRINRLIADHFRGTYQEVRRYAEDYQKIFNAVVRENSHSQKANH